MLKAFSFSLLLALALDARENPFFPSSGELDIPLTNNQIVTIEPLKRATITLPSTARTIESLTIKYKNLDGSLVDKTISLGNAVDWHLPLFFSQNIALHDTGNTRYKKREKYVKIAKLKFISLHEGNRNLKIITKDRMIRNFLLTKPHRIVCDFKRKLNIRSYELFVKDKKSVITKVRFGNHDGYYRVVIELDGYYSYKKLDIKNGYLLNFL